MRFPPPLSSQAATPDHLPREPRPTVHQLQLSSNRLARRSRLPRPLRKWKYQLRCTTQSRIAAIHDHERAYPRFHNPPAADHGSITRNPTPIPLQSTCNGGLNGCRAFPLPPLPFHHILTPLIHHFFPPHTHAPKLHELPTSQHLRSPLGLHSTQHATLTLHCLLPLPALAPRTPLDLQKIRPPTPHLHRPEPHPRHLRNRHLRPRTRRLHRLQGRILRCTLGGRVWRG